MRNKPKIRFKGFTEDWEQRKFKDIAFKRGKISEADLPYVEFEDINSGIGTLNKNILQKVGHKKGILFEAGDVLFGKLRPYLQNWLLCQFMGIAVGDFWVFQPQIVSSAFLYYLIQSEAYQSVANISSGTKMPRSSWSLVSETGFSIPKYKEAIMIGEFLTSIDKNITLHQRKLEKLKLAKKALLQKLFPKNGSQFPEIRFKGFTDAWEQCKLSDLMEVTSVKRIHQVDWTDSGVRFFRARDIVSSMNNEEIDNPVFISKDKYEEYSRVSGKVIEGDLLVTGVGTIGVPYLIKDTTPLYFKDGNIIWFKNNNTLNGSYFYYCFQNSYIQNQIYSASGKGTVGTYTIENGKKTSIRYPSLKEQIKIGNLLDTMTTMITLHQCKLDKLQDVKKGLLQKMFV